MNKMNEYTSKRTWIQCVSDCYANTVTLSSQSLDQWENTDVTLTCSYIGTFPGLFIWFLKSSSEELSTAVYNNCSSIRPWLSNTTVYSLICINATVQTVTLKSITQQRHGETWRCGFNPGQWLLNSSTLQIFVKGNYSFFFHFHFSDILEI